MIIVKKYAKGGDIETPNGAFMKWYTNWLKKTIDNYEIYVFISIPNEISLPTLADVNGADNVVIIDHIEKIGNADVKKYMQEITDKADELGVIIYLMPVPRTHKLTEAHKKKITKDYLIGYYEKFGFKKHNDYMVRNPKMAMGGQMPNNTFVGKKIKLIAMNEEPNPVEPNTMGTIRLIDGIGQTRATDKDIEDGNLKDMIEYGVSKERSGYMKKGGITGDLHSLTNQLVAQKIEIFIDKVKPIKYYFIDEDKNFLIVGLDENYTTGMAEKLYKEAKSSMEFFDAESINMEKNKTGGFQYSIGLKKEAKFDKGGTMDNGGVFRKNRWNPKMAMGGGQMPNNTFVGKRIKLIAMNEEPNPVEPNTMGTIRLIDGIGQIHVDWDNGRSLAVVPEIDEYEIID